MAHVDQYFGGKWAKKLKHDDLEGKPQIRTLVGTELAPEPDKFGRTLLEIELEEDPDVPAGWKTQLSAPPRLVKEIAEAVSEPDFDRWGGLRVELYPTTAQGGGKTWPVVGARKASDD